MVRFEEDPDISVAEGYGTEDVDVIDTEETQEDPSIVTEEGYGNIDPDLDK